jgi:hypothetical protein
MEENFELFGLDFDSLIAMFVCPVYFKLHCKKGTMLVIPFNHLCR